MLLIIGPDSVPTIWFWANLAGRYVVNGLRARVDYAGWCALSDQELARHDIAEVNLLCALGLPGSEGLDVAASCQQLDHWAELVRRAIDHYQPQYKRNPDRFDGSPGKFRMEVLVSVLQLELGVKYYEPFKNTFHAYDSRAVFAHGVLSGFGGTCVSLPVINVAVGRRLGYPLYLVESREHCFARWDEPGGERFNIECAGRGSVLTTTPIIAARCTAT